jgi:hypothetical protein
MSDLRTPDENRPPIDAVMTEALCEPCGTWHTIRLSRTGMGLSTESTELSKIRPVCWVCGHTPLATTRTVGYGKTESNETS